MGHSENPSPSERVSCHRIPPLPARSPLQHPSTIRSSCGGARCVAARGRSSRRISPGSRVTVGLRVAGNKCTAMRRLGIASQVPVPGPSLPPTPLRSSVAPFRLSMTDPPPGASPRGRTSEAGRGLPLVPGAAGQRSGPARCGAKHAPTAAVAATRPPGTHGLPHDSGR
jgi:hypothetical protein